MAVLIERAALVGGLGIRPRPQLTTIFGGAQNGSKGSGVY